MEAVFGVRGYQQPVIEVREGWASRSRRLENGDNPHRWWNTTGDWKRSGSADPQGSPVATTD